MISILVLKDGQIAEQGNFKELLAIDGIFASMWADQVSATDDPVLSISGTGVKNEVSGYIVDPEETKQEETRQEETKQEVTKQEDTKQEETKQEQEEIKQEKPQQDEPQQDKPQQDKPQQDNDKPQQDKPQDIAETLDTIVFPAALDAESVDVPAEEEQVEIDVPLAAVAVGEGPLPQSEHVDNVDTPNTAPIIPVPVNLQPSVTTAEFPATLKTPQPEMRRSDSPISFPAVTFGVNSPPSRTGTPGPEDEGKRKRISSQNFQRLARRISLSTRRQGSMSSIIPNIPGLKRSESPRASTDDNDTRAEGSTTDSRASSVKGDDKGKSKKKDKKANT